MNIINTYDNKVVTSVSGSSVARRDMYYSDNCVILGIDEKVDSGLDLRRFYNLYETRPFPFCPHLK